MKKMGYIMGTTALLLAAGGTTWYLMNKKQADKKIKQAFDEATEFMENNWK